MGKRKTLNSTSDDDESTLTRISECSDDSNLIKLDLSQLVGGPPNNTEEPSDARDEKDITTHNLDENELLPISSSHEDLSDKNVLTIDEKDVSSEINLNNVESSKNVDSTLYKMMVVSIPSSETTLTSS